MFRDTYVLRKAESQNRNAVSNPVPAITSYVNQRNGNSAMLARRRHVYPRSGSCARADRLETSFPQVERNTSRKYSAVYFGVPTFFRFTQTSAELIMYLTTLTALFID